MGLSGTGRGMGRPEGELAQGGAGVWMRPLGFIKSLIPRLHDPDFGRIVFTDLRPQFHRLGSEEHTGEAGASPGARTQTCPRAR